MLVSLSITPLEAKKAVGQFQNFIVNATYSNGNVKNVTQNVDYLSSDRSVAVTGVDPNSKSKVLAKAPGLAIVSAKDPATGITTPPDESASFTVTEASIPTPTKTGPTSTGRTATPTLTPSPTPSATPVLTRIELKPKTAQKPIGTPQNFTATGTFSDGSTRNITGLLEYTSSDPSVASAPNEAGNPGKILTARDRGRHHLGVRSGNRRQLVGRRAATLRSRWWRAAARPLRARPRRRRCRTRPAIPRRRASATSAARRGATSTKKLKTLEQCGGAASTCVQRKPNDPECLPAVRTRCASALGKLVQAESRMIAAVIKRCAGLSSNDVLGADGLGYGEIAKSCAARFGRALSDLTSVAQCLAAQHSCGAETLFALERPRAGELLDLLQAPLDAGGCREDFGGSGLGTSDPNGLGKLVDRLREGAGTRRGQPREHPACRWSDAASTASSSARRARRGNAACLAKATQKCERDFGRAQREIGKLTVAVARRCQGVEFDVLRDSTGANLDAVTPDVPELRHCDRRLGWRLRGLSRAPA